jgi:D-3-phosphoglycerate dehydrogenase / 2-oxoglutarate reductase
VNRIFTAPLDFDSRIWEWYYAPAGFVHPNIEVWVCDPKANFVIDDGVLDRFPNLRILATPSTGTNHIDLEACKRRGIKVISLLDDRNSLDKISASAEFTLKLLLDAMRKPPALELQDKAVGLVGHGRIGSRMHKWLEAMGVYVYVHDPAYHPICQLPELFSKCDAVVICCSLTPETYHMITGDLLRLMRKGAALVNTARGEIIDEEALIKVMKERPDLRVAVDVIEGEVNGTAQPERLRELGAIVTPHIAGETYDSRSKAAVAIYWLLEREGL